MLNLPLKIFAYIIIRYQILRANKDTDEREKERGRKEEGKENMTMAKRMEDNKRERERETGRDRHTKVQALHHNKTHTTSS